MCGDGPLIDGLLLLELLPAPTCIFHSGPDSNTDFNPLQYLRSYLSHVLMPNDFSGHVSLGRVGRFLDLLGRLFLFQVPLADLDGFSGILLLISTC